MPFQPNPAEKANDFPHALPAEVTSNELTIYVLPTVYDPGLQPRPRAMEVRGQRVEQGAPKVIEHGPGPNVIEHGPGKPLAFSIETDKTSCDLGEPVLIAVIADNLGAQAVETVFNPVFSGPAPTGFLTFEVIGRSGQALPYEGVWADFVPPAMWPKHRVPPGGYLIEVVDLLEAYNLSKPDIYRLRATYRMPFQPDPAKLGFDFPHALPADATSNELTITVLPSAYAGAQPGPRTMEVRGERVEQGGPKVIEHGPAQPLAFSIETDKTTCELGEPILVAVIADNMSSQTVETVFEPAFMDPAGLLTFEVVGTSGQALPYEGVLGQPLPPGMWPRYRVPPRGYLIEVVDLLEAYNLSKPDVYRLRATYRMPSQPDPAKPGFDFPHALPAEVTSNELTIVVLPGGYARRQPPQPGAVEARGQRVEQGTCLVPLRGLAYHLGATIVGNGDQGTAELMASKGARVSVAAGRREASANGRPLHLVMAPRSMDGDLIVPLRPVAEALGAKVIWDDAQSRAYIVPRA